MKLIPRVDYHIHTYLCGHAAAEMTVEHIVQSLAARGIRRAAITEHVGSAEQLDRVERIRRWVAAQRTDMEILVGAELEADPRRLDGSFQGDLESALNDAAHLLDVRLAATHRFPGSRHGWHEELNLSPEEKRRYYHNWLHWVEALVQNPRVEVLAHPAVLMGRNGIVPRFDEPGVLRDIRSLLELMCRHDVAFEFNERVPEKLTPLQQATYPELFRLALESGVLVSVGSDAHHPDEVGRYPWIARCLGELGAKMDTVRWFRPRVRSSRTQAVSEVNACTAR